MNVFIAQITNQTAILMPEESWHCAKVLRYKTNDIIELIDGKGAYYKGVLTLVHEKKCEAKITAGPIYQAKKGCYLHLAIAPTKQIDRVEWLLEKAVEIGIDEITFIKCKNSERVAVKTERIQKIIESAVKQSKQALIPKLNPLTDFKDMLSLKADLKLIAHCQEGKKINIKETKFSNTNTLVLIGPEGDFTKEEVELATKASFKSINLGINRLRTETAGLYVVQAVSILT